MSSNTNTSAPVLNADNRPTSHLIDLSRFTRSVAIKLCGNKNYAIA
jgi:hypothetical protein